MSPILIVGYGNTLRGDDGAGCSVAEGLGERWPENSVRVETAHQLVVELAPLAAESEFVVFIDATREGAPGEVRLRPVSLVELGRSSLTHHLTPEALLAVAQSLYGRRPEAFLVTIAGEDFAPGESFSPKVEGAVSEAVRRVGALVDERLKVRAHA